MNTNVMGYLLHTRPLLTGILRNCITPIVLTVLLATIGQAQDANLQRDPAKFVSSEVNRLTALIAQARDENWDAEYFDQQLVDNLLPLIEPRLVTASVMGILVYKAASKAQRKRFQEVFITQLLNSYSRAIRELEFERVSVLDTGGGTPEQRRVNIDMEVVTAGQTVRMTYSLYWHKTKGWQVINIQVAGVDVVQIFQSQFKAAMVRYKGDLDKVIDTWVVNADDLQ